MPRIIPHEDKAIIKRLLNAGYKARDVVEHMDGKISLRTVKTIKKELEQTNTASSFEDSQNKYTLNLTKKEEKYAKLLDDYQKYEDVYEGWVFHITQEQFRLQKSAKVFWAIVYPESASEGWVDKLEATGLEIAISPLHDMDIWTHDSPEIIDPNTKEVIFEKGSRYKKFDYKKSHWHVKIKFPNKISFEDANNLIRPITNGPYLQQVFSVKGTFNYLTHKGNPDKFPYDDDEIVLLNGFIVEPNDYDKKLILSDIFRTIKEQNFITFADLVSYFEYDVEYIAIIGQKAFALQSVITDNWRKEQRDKDVAQLNILLDAIRDIDNEELYKIAIHNAFATRYSDFYKPNKKEEVDEDYEDDFGNIVVYDDDFEEE